MPTILWIAVSIMTVAALSFVLVPLAGSGRRATFAVLAVAVPAFSAGAYFELGSPGVASASSHADAAGSGRSAAASHEQPRADSISNLVGGLAARLEEHPEDGGGWLLLAKSYQHLGRPAEARAAYAHAVALGESDPSLEQLVAGESAAVDAAAANGPAITGSVDLSPALREIVEPTDVLFIFARAPGQAGPPLAVVRRAATAWPIEFRLTDAESMVDGLRLSNAGEVVVTARLSRSGEAGDALNGLEAKSLPIEVGSATPVQLIIE